MPVKVEDFWRWNIGSKKTTSTVENKAPQFVEQPKNQFYDQAKANLDNLDLSTPIIQAYGQQDNLIKESGNDFFGANTSPEMAQKVRESRLFRSQTDKGRDLSNAKQQEINAKTSGYMNLGQATAPVMYSPGGTTTQKTPYSLFDWANLGVQGMSSGAQVAQA